MDLHSPDLHIFGSLQICFTVEADLAIVRICFSSDIAVTKSASLTKVNFFNRKGKISIGSQCQFFNRLENFLFDDLLDFIKVNLLRRNFIVSRNSFLFHDLCLSLCGLEIEITFTQTLILFLSSK